MDKIFERMHQHIEQRTQQWHSPALSSSLLENKGTYYQYNTQIKEGQNNQIDISIEDCILHLKATTDTTAKTEKAHMQTQQYYVGMIQRSQTLPDDVDATTLKSGYKNGMLVLTLQKIKSLKHPVLKDKEKQVVAPVQEAAKKKEKKEANTTKVKVPHTNSHV